MRFGALLATPALALLCANACAQSLIPASTQPDTASTQTNKQALAQRQQLIDTILRATAQADVPTLASLYQQTDQPMAHCLAAMALERVHGHWQQSDQDGEVCEQGLIDRFPGVAQIVARYRAGTWRVAGRNDLADAAERDLATRFATHLGPKQAQELQQRVNGYVQGPHIQVSLPAAGGDIPLLSDQYDGKPDVVQVQANGHSTKLVLDTGAAGALLLDTSTAKDLGVRMTGGHGKINGLLSEGLESDGGMLDSLTIGGVRFEHVPVQVTSSHANLFGLELIKRMGALRFSKQGIHLYGPGEPRPAITNTLLFGSGIDGYNVKLLTSLPVNGTPYVSVIDTGDHWYLNGNKAARTELDTRMVGHLGVRDVSSAHNATVSRAKATIEINGQPIQVGFVVIDEANLPWSFILGRDALDDMDIYLDAAQGQGSLVLHQGLH